MEMWLSASTATPGHAVRLEMMQVDMQQRRARRVDAAAQRRLDVIDVVEALGVVEVDDQMHAGAAHAVAVGEMILAILRRLPAPPL